MKRKKPMQDTLTIDDIEKEAQTELTPDIVAARCTEYEFNGKKLAPMTKSRVTAARCMGAKIFLGTAERAENGIWPEMTFDAQIVVWLCTVDETRVRRAVVKPSVAIGEVFDWWEAFGGLAASKLEMASLEIMGSIISDIETVAAETDSSGRGSSNSENLGE